MKTLKESLFNKNNLESNKDNKYGITKDDMIGQLEGFPVGVVVRMVEEQERQGNKADVKVFQKCNMDANEGFEWLRTEAGHDFWLNVIGYRRFNFFFEKYPEYEKYN